MYYYNQEDKHTFLFDKLKTYTIILRPTLNTYYIMLLNQYFYNIRRRIRVSDNVKYSKESLNEIVHNIKKSAIIMQRNKPSE